VGSIQRIILGKEIDGDICVELEAQNRKTASEILLLRGELHAAQMAIWRD